MPDMNAMQTIADIVRYFPDTKVIILSMHDDVWYVVQALKRGAQGYLLKEMDPDSFMEAIKIVHEGGVYLHPKVTHHLMKEYLRLAKENVSHTAVNAQGEEAEFQPPLHILSKRENQVLQLLAAGKRNCDIAETLYISEKTVKIHVSNILKKLHVTDRTQAAVVAIRNGWV